jgi:hypothetical protein
MPTNESPSVYHERLRPALWVYLATGLVIPASLLVFLPISPLAGVVAAIVLELAILIVLFVTTPTIQVSEGELHAGRARIPLEFVARASGFRGAEATAERGTRLDTRAWLLLRGWIDPVVHIELSDPDDPTPYWLVSTRRPEELVAALGGAGARD